MAHKLWLIASPSEFEALWYKNDTALSKIPNLKLDFDIPYLSSFLHDELFHGSCAKLVWSPVVF